MRVTVEKSVQEIHASNSICYGCGPGDKLESPPCTVTASYSVKLKRPTPFGKVLSITSKVEKIENNVVEVSLNLVAGGKKCATGQGLFVAVKEGHPAFHRWS